MPWVRIRFGLALLVDPQLAKLTLSREKKLKGVHLPVLTSFQYGQQNQKLFRRRSRKSSVSNPPYFGKPVHRMFGIVVIPRDSVVIQKSEQSVAILLEAALIF
jgi:hypothetical protein